MALEAVMERFKENSPLTVMARLLMQQALSQEWLEEVFEQNRDKQYTRATSAAGARAALMECRRWCGPKATASVT